MSKKKLQDFRIKVNSCRTVMAYASGLELRQLNLEPEQWVTVVGECDKPHVAYVSNYDRDLDLWFFMVEREPISE